MRAGTREVQVETRTFCDRKLENAQRNDEACQRDLGMDDNAVNKTGIHRSLLTCIHMHIHT